MKVLVLGSGAKDHAIVYAFSKSRVIDGLYIAPCNPGTKQIAVNLEGVDPANKHQVYQACIENGIDFVFIGTEAPLFTGVVDFLTNKGIFTFGAPGYALKLEGNRQFSRQFTMRYGIPTPAYKIFNDINELKLFLQTSTWKSYVVKKNTISPSRLMIDSKDHKTIINFAKELMKDGPVILEEHKDGIPVTVSLILDNSNFFMLPICSDYHKSEENDIGMPTGGLGSICPLPLSKTQKTDLLEKIIKPTLIGLENEGLAYRGILTFSIIFTKDSPILIDYHVRLNDPATQTMVPIIENDIGSIMEAVRNNRLDELELVTNNYSTVSVVIASRGYPDTPETGKEVTPIPSVYLNNVLSQNPYIFCGAVKEIDGKIVTTGGRNFTIVGVGNSVIEANAQAYSIINSIKFDGCWYRKDIGNKFFEN